MRWFQRKRERTVTFDFQGPVENTEISDVESSADELIRAPKDADVRMSNIRHRKPKREKE